MVNRKNVGTDGKVAYERIKGKKPTMMGIEFGEKVLYKIKLGQRLEKINSRWDFGIFVGVRRKSNEMWIATRDGTYSKCEIGEEDSSRKEMEQGLRRMGEMGAMA